MAIGAPVLAGTSTQTPPERYEPPKTKKQIEYVDIQHDPRTRNARGSVLDFHPMEAGNKVYRIKQTIDSTFLLRNTGKKTAQVIFKGTIWSRGQGDEATDLVVDVPKGTIVAVELRTHSMTAAPHHYPFESAGVIRVRTTAPVDIGMLTNNYDSLVASSHQRRPVQGRLVKMERKYSEYKRAWDDI